MALKKKMKGQLEPFQTGMGNKAASRGPAAKLGFPIEMLSSTILPPVAEEEYFFHKPFHRAVCWTLQNKANPNEEQHGQLKLYKSELFCFFGRILQMAFHKCSGV